jgi:hypothetical protein
MKRVEGNIKSECLVDTAYLLVHFVHAGHCAGEHAMKNVSNQAASILLFRLRARSWYFEISTVYHHLLVDTATYQRESSCQQGRRCR